MTNNYRYYYCIDEAADVLGNSKTSVIRRKRIGHLLGHPYHPGLISKCSVENYLYFKRWKCDPFAVSVQNKDCPLWTRHYQAANYLGVSTVKLAGLIDEGLVKESRIYNTRVVYMPSLLPYKKYYEKYKRGNLTLKEAANYANMTSSGISYLVKRGKLNFISSSPKRISKKDLDEYLRSKAIKKVLSNSSYRYEESASHLDRCAKILKNLDKLGLIDKALP